MRKFVDGVISFVNDLTNRRTATAENGVYSQRLTPVQLNELYRSGLGNKIIRFKAGGALRNTLQFARTEDEQFYRDRLAEYVKEATRWMLAYGRGVVLIQHPGDDLTKALGRVDPERLQLRVFDGGMATGMDPEIDLQHPRYMLPRAYNIRGVSVHHSRIVDFTYVKPTELERPYYHYGGISEFELIYDQMIADGVVQRASPRVIEKASTLFYKVAGFKDAMAANEHSDMVGYFGKLEQLRGIFSAGLIDKEDDLEVVAQNIANLADADLITLRRLAMVTGISFTALVGESPKGLNATGEQERVMDQNMLEALQSDYLLRPINELMYKTGQGVVAFKDNQGETPNGRIDYETKAIDNAVKLASMGEDYGRYLRDKGVTVQDDYTALGFVDEEWDESKVNRTESGQFGTGGAKTQPPPTKSLKSNLAAANEAGFNTDEVFVHRTSAHRGPITEISPKGNFPGLFALGEDDADQAATYGSEEYRFVIKGDPWTDSDLQSAMWDQSEKVDDILSGYTDDDDVKEQLEGIVSGESLEYTEEVADALGAIDEADFYKEAQILRMKVAAELGAPAVRMEDEFGTDTVAILPGPDAMIVSTPDTENDEA